LIGLRRAFGLVFLNPRLEAREALDAGLINDVFPEEKFDAEVLAIAQRLAAGPTQAYGVTKRLINEASGIDRLDAHMDKELRNLAEIAQGEDFSEGLEAFFTKQAAHFKGNGR
jgi:enoyl-CoA hydratase/carnithine racemase